jgi:hypothetical protein
VLLDCYLYEQTLSNRDQAKPIPAAVTQAVTLKGFGGNSSSDGMRTVDFSAPVRMYNKLENGKFVFSLLYFNTICALKCASCSSYAFDEQQLARCVSVVHHAVRRLNEVV